VDEQRPAQFEVGIMMRSPLTEKQKKPNYPEADNKEKSFISKRIKELTNTGDRSCASQGIKPADAG
jgi:hypothetical protein